MTTNILHIDSSPLGDRSVSRKFSAKTVAALQARYPDNKVVVRDFGSNPLPHLSSQVLGAFFTPAEQRDSAATEAIKLSDQAVDEVLAADIIVIGAPMWNFGIPSSLKAWIDHISRAGRTFKYTATGAQGLVPSNKKVIIASARGGVYTQGPQQQFDFQENYLKAVLGFMGLTDVSFVRAEGVALGEDGAKKAAETAEAQLNEIIQTLA